MEWAKQNCFRVIIYSLFEFWGYAKSILSWSKNVRQKYLIVFRECARSFKAYKENMAISKWFSVYEVVSKYAKSILTCTKNKNTLKEYKCLRRIRQEHFAVYWEYADLHKISMILVQNQKKSDPKSPSKS